MLVSWDFAVTLTIRNDLTRMRRELEDDDAVTHPTSHTYTCQRGRGEEYAERIRQIRLKKRRRKITSLSDRILTRCDDDDSPSAAYRGGLRTFAMERRKTVGGVKNTAYAKNK